MATQSYNALECHLVQLRIHKLEEFHCSDHGHPGNQDVHFHALQHAPGGGHVDGIQELLMTTFREFTSPLPKLAFGMLNASDDKDLEESLKEDGASEKEAAEGEGFFLLLAATYPLMLSVRRMNKTDASSDFVMGYAKETPDLFAEDDDDVEDPTSLQHRHSNVFVKVYWGFCEELRVAVDLKNSTSGRTKGAVCIQVWGTVRWYYGYVEIHEFLQVENESLACFPLTKREALSLTVPGSVPPHRRMIRKKFAEWKANLYGQEMKIPDGRFSSRPEADGELAAVLQRDAENLGGSGGDEMDSSRREGRRLSWRKRSVFQRINDVPGLMQELKKSRETGKCC
ncbi:hypothetical protein SELMODRAFT_415952 [Selaginella moellendorffii]|uniref:Uncharacterized protein n=1 Tax=Selaginella moellendorffii TaxID=88036 RepID=D8RXM3_SELML|nr:hypothetical protein SELMODRAFT_415952 [Selaginella moellendorffii]